MPQAEDTPTLPDFLRERSARCGERLAVVGSGRRLSYAELESESARLARGLLASGVGKGTRVAVLLPNGPDWVLAFAAAARIGALVIPINTFYQKRELGFVLRHADVDTLLCTDQFLGHDYLERLEKIAPELSRSGSAPLQLASLPYLRCVRVWSGSGAERRWTSGGVSALAALADENPTLDDAFLAELERQVHPADPLLAIYSSGSTADPKGAVHTHGAVLRHARNLNQFRDLGPEDRMYSPMPFFWVGGFLFTLISCLEAGACLLTEESFEPGRTLELIEAERATIVAGWPHYGKAMIEHPDFAARDLSSVRTGNLYELLPDGARPPDPELRPNSLGMTETCGPHTFGQMDQELPESLRGSFGVAVPGVEHKVVSPESGETLAPGEFGEICVRGTSVMQGLLKVERADAFDADGYYHTGDGGYFSADGHLFFKGRLGDLIKTGGANVTPREVELALEELPGVLSAFVVGIPDPDRGENVAAAVVPREAAALDAEVLRTTLRRRSPPTRSRATSSSSRPASCP
jgi:acyl-CoA synthetase (AMP-forming)/AMP-acid ligase II